MLTKLKTQAWEAFEKKGLPRGAPLSTESRQPGVVRAELPKECISLPLEQALKTYGALLERTWRKTVSEGRDALSLLNLARMEGGLFVYVPPHVRIDEVVEFVHDGDFTRVHLFLGKGASLSLRSQGSGHLLIDGECEQGSHLHIYRPQGGIDSFRFSLKKEATLNVVSACQGEGRYFQDFYCQLMQEGAHASVRTLSQLRGSGSSHTHIQMKHLAEKTTSEQLVKALVDERALSCFEGSIFIDPVAQLTDARQLSRALLLSKGAQAHARPLLSIGADDVQASHGSTISQLDERALFYLQSRGLAESEAKELLIQGFCQEIINLFPKKVL